MIATTDEVHAVLAAHGDPYHILVGVALGQLFPSLNHGICDAIGLCH
jgi:hypothetical protein